MAVALTPELWSHVKAGVLGIPHTGELRAHETYRAPVTCQQTRRPYACTTQPKWVWLHRCTLPLDPLLQRRDRLYLCLHLMLSSTPCLCPTPAALQKILQKTFLPQITNLSKLKLSLKESGFSDGFIRKVCLPLEEIS